MANNTVSLAGRPSVMTEEVLGKLRSAFLMGFTDREACAYAQINPDTLYSYLKKHPEYSEQRQSWKLYPILKAKYTIYNYLTNPIVAKWYLERKCPEEFLLRTVRRRNVYDEISKTPKASELIYIQEGTTEAN